MKTIAVGHSTADAHLRAVVVQMGKRGEGTKRAIWG